MSASTATLDQEILDLGGDINPEDGSSPEDHQPEEKFYLLVCGGRDFRDGKIVRRILEGYLQTHGAALRIVHGGATGADQHAARWSKARGVPSRSFPADWKTHGKRGGVVRNQEMAAYLSFVVERGHAAHVLAFPGGPGTQHMCEHAKSVGLTVGRIAVANP